MNKYFPMVISFVPISIVYIITLLQLKKILNKKLLERKLNKRQCFILWIEVILVLLISTYFVAVAYFRALSARDHIEGLILILKSAIPATLTVLPIGIICFVLLKYYGRKKSQNETYR